MAARVCRMERGESSRGRAAESSEEEEDIPATPAAERSQPAPSKSQLRAIRSGYRDLQTVISGEKDKLVRDASAFNTLVGHVDNLFGKVERPREQMADLETVCGLSSSLLEYAKKFQERTGPTVADVITGLLGKYQKNSDEDAVQLDWAAIGIDTMGTFRNAPGVSTMVGPMSTEPKPKKKYAGRQREKLGPSTSPEDVVAAENQSSETDKNIESLFKVLRMYKRVRFEALVLNRRSFSQTIENIFALSFLVKDGRVEISVDEDGSHHVVPKNAPAAASRANGSVVNTQFVLRLDYKDWLFMKQKLEQGQELMPDRESAVPAAATPVRITSRNRARETAASQAAEEEPDQISTKRRRRLS